MSANGSTTQHTPDVTRRLRFRLDGRDLEVPEGTTLLAAAREQGIDVPTLCHLERCGPMTSCLVCVMKVTLAGRTSVVPSCAMKVAEGMVVESETTEVHELRRSALELLLSDHVGDCLSPCARICPLGMNIPQMLRQVQLGRPVEAAATVRASLALPSVLGRLCHKPCENGCRRGACDSAAAIRDVERFVADTNRAAPMPVLPSRQPASGHRVAIVGAGPTGLAAAYELSRLGHSCVVLDRHDRAGGALRAEVERSALAADALEGDVRDLVRLGVEFRFGVEVGHAPTLADLQAEFAAVLLAVGVPDAEHRLGVAGTAAGLKAEPGTGVTDRAGVFAAGSCVRVQKQLVKAMAEGQGVAGAIDAFLRGRTPQREGKRFSSIMGRLESVELAQFLRGASRAKRIELRESVKAYDAGEAAAESARCLHCDCRAVGHCGLQHYSEIYGAEFGRFPRQRRAFEQDQHAGRVLFEPGKCILCGICVKIASEAAEPLGLTFVGRGFEVRVAAPLEAPFEDGLQKVARECAEACPTGAIVLGEPTDAHWVR